MEYFEYRRDWSGQRVYFHDESGCLTSMPAEWSSVVPPPPVQVIGEGRARFRLDDLVGLCELLYLARSPGQGQEVER